MQSLGSTEIIFPCRVSDPERRENFKTVLSFLYKTYIDFKVIVVESDIHPVLSDYLSQISNSNLLYVFDKNTERFSRARCLNIGARLATAPIICFHDIDVIAQVEEMRRAIQILRETEISDVRYPHSSLINISGELKKEFCRTLDLSLLDGITLNNLNEDTFILYRTIPSAIVFYRKHQFLSVGGFNESFTGWGGEDNEMLMRSGSLGLVHHSGIPPSFHLHHGPSGEAASLDVRFSESKENGAGDKLQSMRNFSPEEFAELAKKLRRDQFGIE